MVVVVVCLLVVVVTPFRCEFRFCVLVVLFLLA